MSSVNEVRPMQSRILSLLRDVGHLGIFLNLPHSMMQRSSSSGGSPIGIVVDDDGSAGEKSIRLPQSIATNDFKDFKP